MTCWRAGSESNSTRASPLVARSHHDAKRAVVSATDPVAIAPSLRPTRRRVGQPALGLQDVDPSFDGRLQAAYDAAIASGLWVNTYAATNKDEYWAEGVQAWYNANLESDPPDGVHNAINTRAELANYDPGLYQLILEVFPEETIALCPT